MKKYQIIYADPPWSYQDTQKNIGTAGFGAGVRYNLMDNKKIMKLPVNNLANKNCILFIWATSPLLPEALETIKAWGFKYKTIGFCWNKLYKNGNLVSNLGRWTMSNIEICLLATKGHPKRISTNIKQQISALRTSHSKKPEIVRKLIVELMGDLPRIELFCRDDGNKNLWGEKKMQGWDVMGDNIDGTDISETLKNY